MDFVFKLTSFVSSLFTIVASGIAIYIFLTKKEALTSVLSLLLNYSNQLTISELKEKLERLNEYNAKDEKQCDKILILLNEIAGQIKGNDKLKLHFSDTLKTLNILTSNKRRITEPKKRAFVSELRERLRHLNIKNIDDLVGK